MPNSSLRSKLENLAHAFADQVFEAIRTASLDELTGGASRPRSAVTKSTPTSPRSSTPKTAKLVGGRLARRTSDEIEAVLGRVVAALKVGPMRAEEIQKGLGLNRKELPRVLALGLKKKALRKKGQRRGTQYSAA
jgi:hypothetical protein